MENCQVNCEIEVEIEKLVYEGTGLARYCEMPVFIDNVCVGDFVRAKITSSNKSYLKASLVEVLTHSVHRVKPFCPLHNVCGGCQWQFVDYAEQLKQKRQIVREALQKIGDIETEVKEVIPSPKIKNFRYKVQMPVQQTKNSKRFLCGYYKKNSHELVNIKFCPIQPPEMDELIEYIRQKAFEYDVSAYNERKHTGELKHLLLRESKDSGKILLVFVINANEPSDSLKNLASDIYKTFDEITGVCININTKRNNSILTDKTKVLYGNDFYYEKLGDLTYKINANSFFQVNPFSAEIMMDTVKEMIETRFSNPLILDAYSGVSSFGLWMKDIAKEVYCVEECKSATDNALENISINKAQNFKIFNGDAAKNFEKFIEEGIKFDVVLLDPPRKGCSQESLDYVSKLTDDTIIYVSCNPSTLARDLKYLSQFGFETVYVQPVDMFCHSYHVESIALVKKN